MVCVEKNRQAEFLAHAPHQRRRLAHADETALALRHANHHRHADRPRRRHDRFERGQIGKIEMTDRNPPPAGVFEHLNQRFHNARFYRRRARETNRRQRISGEPQTHASAPRACDRALFRWGRQ